MQCEDESFEVVVGDRYRGDKFSLCTVTLASPMIRGFNKYAENPGFSGFSSEIYSVGGIITSLLLLLLILLLYYYY
jgi:hypothetical protein